MNTKTLANGNVKVWFDQEAEFLIVNKNQPLFDTIIDANLIQRKYDFNSQIIGHLFLTKKEVRAAIQKFNF